MVLFPDFKLRLLVLFLLVFFPVGTLSYFLTQTVGTLSVGTLSVGTLSCFPTQTVGTLSVGTLSCFLFSQIPVGTLSVPTLSSPPIGTYTDPTQKRSFGRNNDLHESVCDGPGKFKIKHLGGLYILRLIAYFL